MDVGRIVKIAETVPPPLDLFINGIAFFLDVDGIPSIYGIHLHPVNADRVMLNVRCCLNDFRAASVYDDAREKQDDKCQRNDANLAYGPAAFLVFHRVDVLRAYGTPNDLQRAAA